MENTELSNKGKKSKSKAKKKRATIDANQYYVFISNGKHKAMPKDKRYRLIGATVQVFIKSGYGKIEE